MREVKQLPPPPSGRTGWPWTEDSNPIPERMADGSDWPKISIVTPSFNQGEYIEETIRSVLLQGYPNLEFVIIDGGSTDNSVEVIKKYEPWLHYWVSEPDGGQADAINKGFELATGEILGYLNSDDIFLSGGLFALLHKVDKKMQPRCTIFAGGVQDFPFSVSETLHHNSEPGRIDQWLDGGVSLHQPGCLWTKYLWESCGPFKNDLNFIFDRYFFSMCRVAGAKLITVPDTVAGFRLHAKSKTSSGFLSSDQFSLEWETVKHEIEERLTPGQKIALNYRRNLRENWTLVSAALNSEAGSIPRKNLYRKLLKKPLWMFHRPIAGAIVRLITEKFTRFKR